MKRVLGLDLGTTSIGWAVVDQAASQNEKSNIIQLGVRVNPITVDEQNNFENGRSITTTANRTLKRGMRRSLQRYKQRHVLPSLLCHPIQRYKFESNSQRRKRSPGALRASLRGVTDLRFFLFRLTKLYA